MNTNYEIKDNVAIIRINKEIYPKKVLIQAAYVKLEKYYILIDQDENYFIVSIKQKDNSEMKEENIFEFFDELIESQSYLDQIERTAKIREIILERALLGQTLDDETIENLNKEIPKFEEEKAKLQNESLNEKEEQKD